MSEFPKIEMGKQYETETGAAFTVLAIDLPGEHPVVGWHVGFSRVAIHALTADGKLLKHDAEPFIREVKKEITQWVNFYRSGRVSTHSSETAAQEYGKDYSLLACVKVTFKEGDGLLKA